MDSKTVKHEEISIFDCEEYLIEYILNKVDSIEDGEIITIRENAHVIHYIFTRLLSINFNNMYNGISLEDLDYHNDYLLSVDKDRTLWISQTMESLGF